MREGGKKERNGGGKRPTEVNLCASFIFTKECHR